MQCLRVPVCFAVLFGIVATWSLAEETEGELTADEFVVNAASLYANARYSEAAELYRRFIDDFGSSPDAQTAIRQTYYPLAMCLLRLQRFTEAYQAIKDAFEKNLDLDRAQAQELLFWKGVCEINQQDPQARKTLEDFLSQFPPGLEGNAGYARRFPSDPKNTRGAAACRDLSPPGGKTGRGGRLLRADQNKTCFDQPWTRNNPAASCFTRSREG